MQFNHSFDLMQIDRFIRNSFYTIHDYDIAFRDLEVIRIIATTRFKRANLNDAMTQKKDVITASQCRLICFKRQTQKKEKMRRKKAREKKKTQNASNFSLQQIFFLINKPFIDESIND